MKRVLVLLLIVLMFGFVVADNHAPSVPGGIGEGDVKKIGELQEKFSPLDESGKVDFGKYKPFYTRAEERIDAINLWLEDNASWLKVVLGMVPSITLLFLLNAYLWLLFFLILVLRGKFLGIGVAGRKFDLGFGEFSIGQILGAVLFVVLLLTKVIANLARTGYTAFGVFWNYILPAGIVLAVIAIIIAIVLLIVLIIYAPGLAVKIGEMIGAHSEKKAKEEEAFRREVLKKTVEGISGE